MSIDALLKYVTYFKEGRKTLNKRKDLLLEQRDILLEKQKNIEKTLERLEYKLKIYDEIIEGKRKDFMEEP